MKGFKTENQYWGIKRFGLVGRKKSGRPVEVATDFSPDKIKNEL
jgi:hypothetical protein